jgi:hypothetical protein
MPPNRRRKLPVIFGSGRLLLVSALLLLLNMTQCASGKYLCSSVTSREDLARKLENCSQVRSSSNTGLQERHDTILKIVENLLTESPAIKATSQRSTLINVLDIISVLDGSEQLKRACGATLGEILASCHFPAEVIDRDELFESNAILAAHVASKLTALGINERIESKVFLTRTNIYSLLRLSLVDYEDVYDAKVVFTRFNDQDKFMFHAYKNLNTKCNLLLPKNDPFKI